MKYYKPFLEETLILVYFLDHYKPPELCFHTPYHVFFAYVVALLKELIQYYSQFDATHFVIPL